MTDTEASDTHFNPEEYSRNEPPPMGRDVEARVNMIKNSIEDPSVPEDKRDKEGAKLYKGIQEAFKKAVKKPEESHFEMGNTIFSYKTALEASKKMLTYSQNEPGEPREAINDPAEVNKAINALRTFYNQMDLGEYSVNVAVTEEELKKQEDEIKRQLEIKYKDIPEKSSYTGGAEENPRKARIEKEFKEAREKNRQSLIRKQIRADVSRMPEQFASKKMQPYYEERAREQKAQETVVSKLPPSVDTDRGKKRKLYEGGLGLSSLPPRDLTRINAHDIQAEDRKIERTINRISDMTGDPDLAGEVMELRKERQWEEKEEYKPWEERTPEERGRLVQERTGELQNQIRDSLGEKGFKAYMTMPSDERRMILENLVARELRAQHTYNAVEEAIGSGSSIEICDRLNEAKEARLEVKSFLAETQIAIASQKSKNAADELSKKAREIFAGKNYSLSLKELTDLAGLVRERAVTGIESHIEPIKQKIIEVADSAVEMYDGTSDKLAQGITAIASEVNERVGKQVESSYPAIRAVNEELRVEAKSVLPWLDRKRRDVESWFFRRRGNVEKEFDRSKQILSTEGQFYALKGVMKAKEIGAGIVGKLSGDETMAEDVKRMNEERMEKLVRVRRKMIDRVDRRVEKEHKKSPGFEYFWNEANAYVKGLPPTEEAPAAPEPVAEATGTVPDTVSPPDTTPVTVPPDATADTEPKKDWKPEGDEAKEMWEEISKLKVKAENKSRKDHNSEVREWGMVLRDGNSYLDRRLPPVYKNDKFNGNKEYEEYLDQSTQLARLNKELSDLQDSGKLTPAEEDRRLKEYQKRLQKKWELYDKLRKV